jgi:hypothetical protein
MSLFIGFIERTNTIQVLIESYGSPFEKLACGGFQHESLQAIGLDSSHGSSWENG